MAGKPIVFIKPLSENLQKLKDTIAADEAFSIYEIESVAEFNQLVNAIGAHLTICSDLKKMAKVLSDNKVMIKQHNSKSLLLSSEKLPFSVTDKLQKLGLSEILYEPIVPKTLLYKVSLLCKSLRNVEKKQAEEVVIKSLKQDKDSAETKLEEKNKQAAQLAEDTKAREEKANAEVKPEKPDGMLSQPASNHINHKNLTLNLTPEEEKTNQAKVSLDTSDVDENKKGLGKDFNLGIEDDSEKKQTAPVTEEEAKAEKKKAALEAILARKKALKEEALVNEEKKEEKKKSLGDLAMEELPEIKAKEELAQAEISKKARPEFKPQEIINKERKEKEKVLADELDQQTPKQREAIKRDENNKSSQEKQALELDEIAPKEKPKFNSVLEELEHNGREIAAREEKLAREKTKKFLQLDEIEERERPEAKAREEKEMQQKKGALSPLQEAVAKQKTANEADKLKNLTGLIGKKKEEADAANEIQKKEKSDLDKNNKKQKDLNLDLVDDPQASKDLSELENENDRKKDFDLALEDDEEEKKKREAITKAPKKTKDLNLTEESPELNLNKKFEEDNTYQDLELKEIPQVADNNWDYEEQDKDNNAAPVDLGEQTINYQDFDEYIDSPFAQYKRTKPKKNNGTEPATGFDEIQGTQKETEESEEELYKKSQAETLLEQEYNNSIQDKVSTESEDSTSSSVGSLGHLAKEKKAGNFDINEEISTKKNGQLTIEESLKLNKKTGEAITLDEIDKKAGTKSAETIAEEKKYGKKIYTDDESSNVLAFKAKQEDAPTVSDVPWQEEELIIIDAPIIPADLKGIEYLIGVQRLLQHESGDSLKTLDFIADKLLLKTNSLITFYEFRYGLNQITFSSHEGALESEVYLEMPWSQFEVQNKSRWEQAVTPEWRDGTYTQSLNEFIYPFYEGDNYLGFAVLHTRNFLTDDNSAFYIEVLVETARAHFLASYEVNHLISMEVDEKKSKVSNGAKVSVIKVVKNFFSNLFKKAA